MDTLINLFFCSNAENELRSAISAELQLNFLEAKNRELNLFNSRGSRVGLVAPFGSHVGDLVPPPRMFSDPSVGSATLGNDVKSSAIVAGSLNQQRFSDIQSDVNDQEMTEQHQIVVSSSLPKRSALKKTRFGSYPIPSNQINSCTSYPTDVRSSPNFSSSVHSSNPLSHNSTQIT